MKFSIIVPIYKVEKYLGQCIDSILAQEYTDYELLLIDDGSPDACPTICDEYAKKDSRIKVVHKPNGGLVSARKAGSEIAQGEYVLNIDGDDFVEEGYLSTIANAIEISGNADIIAWGYNECRKDSSIPNYNKLSQGLYKGESLEDIRSIYLYDKTLKGCVIHSIIISIWSKAVKRELYQEYQRLVDNRIDKGEDGILVWMLLHACDSVYILEYAGYNYRIIENSMIRKVQAGDFQVLELLIEEMRKHTTNVKYENQLRCYTLFRLMDLFTLASKTYDFAEFKKIIKTNLEPKLLSYALHGKIYRKRWKERVKILLLRTKAWRTLYLILKNY